MTELDTRWALLKAHVEEHDTHLEVIRELLERVVGLEEQLAVVTAERDEARQIYIEDEVPSREFLEARGWPVPEGYRH